MRKARVSQGRERNEGINEESGWSERMECRGGEGEDWRSLKNAKLTQDVYGEIMVNDEEKEREREVGQ